MEVIAPDAERRWWKMISNDERRTAAARLRQFLSEPWNERSWYHDSLQNVGSLVGTSVGENIIARLADLIDRPTCHDIASHGGMQPAGAIQWFECSECHCKAQTDKIGMALHFCPHCGAEVVE